MAEPQAVNPQDLLTLDEVASRLKVTRNWVYNSARKRSGGIPALRVGKFLRFHWPDVCAWLRERQRA